MAGIEGEEDYDVFDPGDDMSEMAPLTQHRSVLSLRCELTESTIGAFYKSLGLEPPKVLDPNDFEVKNGGHLHVKNDQGQSIQLTTKKDPLKFLALSTIRQRLSVREQNRLGISKPKLDRDAVAKLQNTLQ